MSLRFTMGTGAPVGSVVELDARTGLLRLARAVTVEEPDVDDGRPVILLHVVDGRRPTRRLCADAPMPDPQAAAAYPKTPRVLCPGCRLAIEARS